jgi:hypothetical protein
MRRWLNALCVLYAPWTAAAVLKPRPTYRQALARLSRAMAGLQVPMANFGVQLGALAKAAAALAEATSRPPPRRQQ